MRGTQRNCWNCCDFSKHATVLPDTIVFFHGDNDAEQSGNVLHFGDKFFLL